LSRLATSFVLGYHGCDEAVGRKAVTDGAKLIRSEHDYDWLGPGAYFWESDPVRALEWAQWKAGRGEYEKPFVVGAAIDLGNCLDLLARENLELVRSAHASYVELQRRAGFPIPENRNAGKGDIDRRLRYLDCAVIRHLHSLLKQKGQEPLDTVRGMFTEGGELYEGSGFAMQNHVQIAVCNDDCIRGLFIPRPYPGNPSPRPSA
jgi:hypothetical protein